MVECVPAHSGTSTRRERKGRGSKTNRFVIVPLSTEVDNVGNGSVALLAGNGRAEHKLEQVQRLAHVRLRCEQRRNVHVARDVDALRKQLVGPRQSPKSCGLLLGQMTRG